MATHPNPDQTPPSNPNPIHVTPATPPDLPACMAIRVPSFVSIPLEHTLYGPDNPTTRSEACTRHLSTWQTHESRYGPDSVKPIKAVYTDPETGEQTVIGYAEWYFYPTLMPGVRREVHPLNDPEHVDVGKRDVMHKWLDPVNDARERFMGDKAHAVLMYMCVDPKWRRRGASTMCVEWGMWQCDELGVPAWLEASEEGKEVYGRLGWEVVCQIQCPGMGFPGMVYWPKMRSE